MQLMVLASWLRLQILCRAGPGREQQAEELEELWCLEQKA
jgi:hypothetical protein